MNRRGFFRGLLASATIIPSVSTKTIVDLAANTWRSGPAAIVFYGSAPAAGEIYRIRPGDNSMVLGALIADLTRLGIIAPGECTRELEAQ